MSERPLSTDDVKACLAPMGIEIQLLNADTSTAVLAAEALSTDVGSIVKSLLFLADREPLLLLVAGDTRVDVRRLAREVEATKVRMAKPEKVLQIAGYAVGGVPPLGHRRPLRTLLDRRLLHYPTVYASAGTSTAIFAVSPQQLCDMTSAEVTDIAD